MIKRVLAALAVAALALLPATSPASASPVKEAATINGCDPGNVCLYDWIDNNYASGFWQRSYVAFANSNETGVDCINLPNKQWHDLNGSPNDTASSLIINWGVGMPTKKVTFYDAAGCGVYGGYYYGYNIGANDTIWETNMAVTSRPSCLRGQCSLNWANRVSSIAVTPFS